MSVLTPQPDLDALLSEMREGAATWRGPGTGQLLGRAADALAAERERADGLAAIVERARQHVASMSDDDEYPLEAMWRSEIMQRLTTAPSDALAAHDAEVWGQAAAFVDEQREDFDGDLRQVRDRMKFRATQLRTEATS